MARRLLPTGVSGVTAAAATGVVLGAVLPGSGTSGVTAGDLLGAGAATGSVEPPVSVDPVPADPVSVDDVSVEPLSVEPVSVAPVSVEPLSVGVVVVGVGVGVDVGWGPAATTLADANACARSAAGSGTYPSGN